MPVREEAEDNGEESNKGEERTDRAEENEMEANAPTRNPVNQGNLEVRPHETNVINPGSMGAGPGDALQGLILLQRPDPKEGPLTLQRSGANGT